MKMGITVHFYDGFDLAVSVHKRALLDALTETAFEAEAYAKQESAVDTGAQRASVFVVTPTASNYAQAAAEATKLRPGVELFPEPGKPSSEEVLLAVGVGYGYWNEVIGKPFLGPAVDQVAPGLGLKCRQIIEKDHKLFLAELGTSNISGNKISAQARRFGR